MGKYPHQIICCAKSSRSTSVDWRMCILILLVAVSTAILSSSATPDSQKISNVSYSRSKPLAQASSNSTQRRHHTFTQRQSSSNNSNHTRPTGTLHTFTDDLVIKDDGLRSSGVQSNNSLPITHIAKHQVDDPGLYSSSRSQISHHNQTDVDELKTSDSRNVAKTWLAPRSDFGDDLDVMPDDDALDEVDSLVDGASSNLSEQRVVRELTKIVSKGMAGATDQVKLETLENWKRRQRERKAVKDSRAKIFEEILTAAITSHPEKTKAPGGKKHTKRKKGEHQRTGGSTGSGGNIPSLGMSGFDSDGLDAETLVQHLQSITSAVDGGSSSVDEGASLVGDDSSSGSIDDSTGSHESNDSDTADKQSSAGSKKSTGSSNTATDRPIVRQFKKIKQQISQRRKQLDQIKKMFNVELALNPKDGTLVGKSTSSKKKKESSESGRDVGDYTIIDDDSKTSAPSSSGRKRSGGGSSSKNAKMSELMAYLRENPDILASVMAELTIDASPAPHSRSMASSINSYSTGSVGGVGNFYGPSSLLDPPDPYDNNGIAPQLTSRKSSSSVRDYVASSHNKHHHLPSELDQYLLDRAAKGSSYGRPITALKPEAHGSETTPEMNLRRLRRQMVEVNTPLESSNSLKNDKISLLDTSLTPAAKTAEARLLQSLRDRQLLNLLKLESVLAEKSQASNKSLAYSSPNGTQRRSLEDSLQNYLKASSMLDNLIQPSSKQQHPQQSANYSNASYNNNNSNDYGNNHSSYNNSSSSHHQQNMRSNQNGDELLHHFMLVNNGQVGEGVKSAQNLVQSYQQQTLVDQQNSRYMPESQQQQQHQQHSDRLINNQAPLSRFREWRDASQSEASSPQQRTSIGFSFDASPVSYDLTTGGSSNAAVDSPSGSQHSSSASTLTYGPPTGVQHPQRHMLNASNHLPLYPEGPVNVPVRQQLLQQQANLAEFADSTVTKPGSQFFGATANRHQVADLSSGSRPTRSDSLFMTRSSITTAPEPVLMARRDKTPVNRLQEEQPEGTRQQVERQPPSPQQQLELGEDDESNGKDGEDKHPVTVDYFSAYKNEMPTNTISMKGGKRRRESENSMDEPEVGRERKEYEGMGAMWAK